MELYIASNNGEIGGGEVMLLHLARAARSLGHQITVIGPAQPAELIEAARDEGFSTITIPAQNRKVYMAGLGLWRTRNREKLLWCNGLLPSLATAGDKNRIVHLHQLPSGLQGYALKLARWGAAKVLVPSHYVAARVKDSLAFENWVAELPRTARLQTDQKQIRLGFLGRPSLIKGTHTLARAVEILNNRGGYRVQLVIGGEAKFIDQKSSHQVEESLSKLGKDVILLGWVEPEVLFAQTDILVVPSEVEESFGLVAAEAMSAQQPLIISHAGALPEVLGEDYPWVFSPGSVEELVQKITELLDHRRNNVEAFEAQLSSAYWRWYENYSPEAGRERLRLLLEPFERSQA
ncbi:MAG: glycosyltransferase family 4 protein [Rothia sp. (in: high G+C Gram-positive bacteria)]|uniref:glycosyltransferase family 4 protein n=1 Tax=Rothia sp. (in: high G+C Gram-positive bacteria) TaxID=1885016 RepID=UPI0026F7BD54|nr:glycosyltransferase family 4 protein [Rothia sp. (in: high G+C Gram-positive bacteria)]